MKKLPSALKEALEGAEQEDRDELAAVLSCYGNPDSLAVPTVWCLSRVDAVKRLVGALGVPGVRFEHDRGSEAMVFAGPASAQSFVDAVRMSGVVAKAMASGGLDAVAAIPDVPDAPSAQPPPPACPELAPDGLRSRLRAVFTDYRSRMTPEDVRDVNAALTWCEVGSSVLPPIWALERLGMAASGDLGVPCTAVGGARGCLVRHLREAEQVPGLNLMLSSCPHDLYTLPPCGDDDSNPLVGYLYSCAAAASDLLPEAKALLALDSCPLNLPEGNELAAMEGFVRDPPAMWTMLLGRVAKALMLDTTGFICRDAAYGTYQPGTLHIVSPAAPPSNPCGPEASALASKAAALLVGVVLRPCQDPGHPVARVRVRPGDWTPTVPVRSAGGPALTERDALRIWFAETHALDEPADPPASRDHDAAAVLEAGDPRWDHGRAAAFYGAVVSILFAHGSVVPKLVEGTAKRLRPDAVVTAAHADVVASDDDDDDETHPDSVAVELVVETNIDARAHRLSTHNAPDFYANMETAFLYAFFGGAETSQEILDNISGARIPCAPEALNAVWNAVGSNVAINDLGIDVSQSLNAPFGNAARLRGHVYVERRVDDDGRLSIAFRAGGLLGDLMVALAAARRRLPVLTKGLVRAIASDPSAFTPTGRGGYADAARYAVVATRVRPTHLAAVVPLNRTPARGFKRQAYADTETSLTIGQDAERDEFHLYA